MFYLHISMFYRDIDDFSLQQNLQSILSGNYKHESNANEFRGQSARKAHALPSLGKKVMTTVVAFLHLLAAFHKGVTLTAL